MTATIRETVTSTMQAAGLGTYVSYADPLIRSLEQDSSNPQATVDAFLAQRGYSQYRDAGRRVAEAVAALGGTTVSGVSRTYTLGEVRDALPASLTRYAQQVTDAINRSGLSRDTLDGLVRSMGARVGSYTNEITQFLTRLSAPAETTEAPGEETFVPATEAVTFDREHAADVIRTAARGADIDEDEVESVLIEAGLVDPPSEDRAVDGDEVARLRQEVEDLKSFARRHGFNG